MLESRYKACNSELSVLVENFVGKNIFFKILIVCRTLQNTRSYIAKHSGHYRDFQQNSDAPCNELFADSETVAFLVLMSPVHVTLLN